LIRLVRLVAGSMHRTNRRHARGVPRPPPIALWAASCGAEPFVDAQAVSAAFASREGHRQPGSGRASQRRAMGPGPGQWPWETDEAD